MIDLNEALNCLQRARRHRAYPEPLFMIDADAISRPYHTWFAERHGAENPHDPQSIVGDPHGVRIDESAIPTTGTIVIWEESNGGANANWYPSTHTRRRTESEFSEAPGATGCWYIVNLADAVTHASGKRWPWPWVHWVGTGHDWPSEPCKDDSDDDSRYALGMLAFGLTSRIPIFKSYEHRASRPEVRRGQPPRQQFSIITYRKRELPDLTRAERISEVRSMRRHFVIAHPRRGAEVHKANGTVYWRRGGPVRGHVRGQGAEPPRQQVRLVGR